MAKKKEQERQRREKITEASRTSHYRRHSHSSSRSPSPPRYVYLPFHLYIFLSSSMEIAFHVSPCLFFCLKYKQFLCDQFFSYEICVNVVVSHWSQIALPCSPCCGFTYLYTNCLYYPQFCQYLLNMLILFNGMNSFINWTSMLVLLLMLLLSKHFPLSHAFLLLCHFLHHNFP